MTIFEINKPPVRPSFFTLLLMISFASVNAVLFSPALPNIAKYFAISANTAQLTITWFLIGYALGQLVYGPFANRWGRKPALYIGIGLQIISSFICVLAGEMHFYSLLVWGRFLLALGSGVGLKMTFTIVSECFSEQEAAKKVSYLTLAFAITPGLSIALGGFLNAHFNWMSCFYLSALYGVILFVLVCRLPETLKAKDMQAFKLRHLLDEYVIQFKNVRLMAAGLLMGCTTCFVYVFAALAPFIAMNKLGMSSEQYGSANLIPPIGMIIGSLLGARLAQVLSSMKIVGLGVLISWIGTILMLLAVMLHLPVLFSLFVPLILCYVGLAFIFAHGSMIAMKNVTDKAHGSAVMSFTNMGLATAVVLSVSCFAITPILLPMVFIGACLGISVLFLGLLQKR